MRRLIIALTDGLRPDAITPTLMPSLHALGEAYTLALRASTVRPSATVAALASLATGVSPDVHKLIEPGLDFLPGLPRLKPIARELGRAGVPTHVVTAHLSLAVQPVARALAAAAGVRRLVSSGHSAKSTALDAVRLLDGDASQVLFVYLPHCDRAGHATGWMSDDYLAAAADVDAGIGLLSTRIADCLLIVVADHGGGGVLPNEHDQPHPINDHIPLILAGPEVTKRHRLTRAISILDVPATVLWWFGLPLPQGYQGRPLVEAFATAPLPAAVAG